MSARWLRSAIISMCPSETQTDTQLASCWRRQGPECQKWHERPLLNASSKARISSKNLLFIPALLTYCQQLETPPHTVVHFMYSNFFPLCASSHTTRESSWISKELPGDAGQLGRAHTSRSTDLGVSPHFLTQCTGWRVPGCMQLTCSSPQSGRWDWLAAELRITVNRRAVGWVIRNYG